MEPLKKGIIGNVYGGQLIVGAVEAPELGVGGDVYGGKLIRADPEEIELRSVRNVDARELVAGEVYSRQRSTAGGVEIVDEAVRSQYGGEPRAAGKIERADDFITEVVKLDGLEAAGCGPCAALPRGRIVDIVIGAVDGLTVGERGASLQREERAELANIVAVVIGSGKSERGKGRGHGQQYDQKYRREPF